MKNLLLCLLLLLFGSVTVWAQKTISGTVTGSDGFPLIGVSIFEKDTDNGTITDIDGKYSINVSEGAIVVFSYTGYATQEIATDGTASYDVVLAEGVALDEVVITALGVQREKKALSYSVTEVDAENFAQARELNVVNSLAGKVAGVNVSNMATGAGGSTRVVIRGNASLSGNNQPLYIVDGIPLDNTNLGSAGMWGGQDWGDGISSLSPDDIESVSVLKGNTASALYGYRSSNGVIIINTKSGSARKGIGVEFNTQFRAESIINNYDFQNEYGHGRNGVKPTTAEEARDRGLYAWGARLDGSNVVQFDGVSRPYSSVGNNLDRFYETGSTFTNTLALTGGNEDFNFRFSASNLDNEDVVPNSGLTRRNFALKLNGKFGKRLSATASTQYINEEVQNRPRLSDSPGNANYTVWLLPPSIDVDNLKGPTDKLGANADGVEFQFNDNAFVTNPWWAAHQFEANSTKNRLLGTFSLRYDIVAGLYAQGRMSIDRYARKRRNLTPYGTAYSTFGQIDESIRDFQEVNAELILGYNQDITDALSLNLFVGGNQLRNKFEEIGGNGSNFNVPFLHAIKNAANQSITYEFEAFQVNSLFASAEIGLLNSIYISGTARNDWFSTLTDLDGITDNDELYLSAGVSYVFTDMLNLPNWFSFGKVRLSWAEVGGVGAAEDPYQLTPSYVIHGQGHNGVPLGGLQNDPNRIPNALLTPLTSTEIEFGADLRFFGDKVGLDFAVYNQATTNDILNAKVSPSSGFAEKVVNIGKMENNGFEALLNIRPVETPDFGWDLTLNFSQNNNKVISLLTEEEDDESLRAEESRTQNAYIEHHEGLPYSQIVGFEYARDASGNIMLDDDGLPMQGELTTFGTGVHPNTYGLGSTLRFKNLSLSFLFDAKTGGKIYAATNAYAYSRGLHKATLEGRDSGLGSVSAENIENYYQRIFNISEQFVQDADFAKLREVVLTYNFPKSILNKTPFTGLNVSLAGRNLALLWSKVDNIDPESTYTNGNGQGLEMFGVPQARSFQVNLGVKF